MSESLRLLETMRADDGRIALLDRHLDRLGRSAAFFGYPLDLDAVRERLAAVIASGERPFGRGAESSPPSGGRPGGGRVLGRPPPLAPPRIESGAGSVQEGNSPASQTASGTRGVRLTLGPEGDAEITPWALADEPFQTVVLHPEPMPEAGGPLCTHKTTRREHYRQPYEWARARGADEAVVVNERGEVTEGTRTNLWLERDGRLWTPPLASGGLAGVMRAHVLATRPETGEAVVTPGDLRSADALFLSNALRGWMPVRLLDPGP